MEYVLETNAIEKQYRYSKALMILYSMLFSMFTTAIGYQGFTKKRVE